MKLGGDGALFYANGRPRPVPGPGAADRADRGRDRRRRRVLRRVPARLAGQEAPGEALASGCRLAARALSLVGARPRSDLLRACVLPPCRTGGLRTRQRHRQSGPATRRPPSAARRCPAGRRADGGFSADLTPARRCPLVAAGRHNGGHGQTHHDNPASRGLRGKHRRHRRHRGDAGQLPRVRLLGDLPARPARRQGRAEAGAAPDPVPDARDGPAARSRPYTKCAQVVGQVMGRLHPHGDSAIYDALVRMAAAWAMRLPLIDGHGNFGSLGGDDARGRLPLHRGAAGRARHGDDRLARRGHRRLRAELRRHADAQPEVLPAAIPNLLVNGTAGIAVGMATNMAPHNLGEVVAAARHLIAHPDAEPGRADAVRARTRTCRPAARSSGWTGSGRPTRPAAGSSGPGRRRGSRRSPRAGPGSWSPSCPTGSGRRR